jgi:hypothetical protein
VRLVLAESSHGGERDRVTHQSPRAATSGRNFERDVVAARSNERSRRWRRNRCSSERVQQREGPSVHCRFNEPLRQVAEPGTPIGHTTCDGRIGGPHADVPGFRVTQVRHSLKPDRW